MPSWRTAKVRVSSRMSGSSMIKHSVSRASWTRPSGSTHEATTVGLASCFMCLAHFTSTWPELPGQVLKVIWCKSTLPPPTDGSVVFARWRHCVPSSSAWFLGPTQVHFRNGILIGSTVCAQFLYFAMSRSFLQRAQLHCKRCISYGNSVRLSVRLSVCLSVCHAGIVSKRQHVGRCSFHR